MVSSNQAFFVPLFDPNLWDSHSFWEKGPGPGTVLRGQC